MCRVEKLYSGSSSYRCRRTNSPRRRRCLTTADRLRFGSVATVRNPYDVVSGAKPTHAVVKPTRATVRCDRLYGVPSLQVQTPSSSLSLSPIQQRHASQNAHALLHSHFCSCVIRTLGEKDPTWRTFCARLWTLTDSAETRSSTHMPLKSLRNIRVPQERCYPARLVNKCINMLYRRDFD